MESATKVEQVPVGAFYVGSIQAARWDTVQSCRKCKCPDCRRLPVRSALELATPAAVPTTGLAQAA